MKLRVLLMLIPLSGCATYAYAPMSSEAYFQSWYHGYYQHSVWGLGKLAAYSDDGYVICGEEKIKVRPIFDTHIWGDFQPKPGQTQEEAIAHNENLLARFANSGVSCRLPVGDAAAPN